MLALDFSILVVGASAIPFSIGKTDGIPVVVSLRVNLVYIGFESVNLPFVLRDLLSLHPSHLKFLNGCHVAIRINRYIGECIYTFLLIPIAMMQRVMLSISDEMLKALEQERKVRKLETVPEAIRSVLGEYFKTKG